MITSILSVLLHYLVKLVLTGGLLFVIALCGVLIVRLWFDRTLVLSPFEHLSANEASAAKGEYFTQLVSEHLKELRALYSGQPTGRMTDEAPLFSTDQLGRGLDLTLPALQGSPFSAIDIQAYGVRVSTLLTDLWRWIERPRAIEGKLWEGPGGLRVTAALTQAAGVAPMRWDLQEEDIETASAELACRILHMLHSSPAPLHSSPARRVFADITTIDFCLFTRAWRAYQNYRTRLLGSGTKEEIEAALKEASELIGTLQIRQTPFPFVPKLAALIQQEQGRPEDAKKSLEDYRALIDKYGLDDESFADLEKRVAAISRPSAEALGLRHVMRPLRPGASVGSEAVNSAGTVCCAVRDAEGRRYILSADHPLAGEPGASVLQPGPYDGGKGPADKVAKLAQIKRGLPDIENTAAGAVAELLPEIEFDQDVPEIGPITGVASEVKIGDRIRIVGRTSGLVEGTVTGLKRKADIGVGAGEVRRFAGLILTSPISAGGDSGAPVMNDNGQLVGMVYGGSGIATIVIPVQPLLDAFEVDLVLE